MNDCEDNKPTATLRKVWAKSEYKSYLSKETYDLLISFNIYGNHNTIAYYMMKKKNRNVRFWVVEDAPNFYTIDKNHRFLPEYIYPLFGVVRPVNRIEAWWFSQPEMMHPFHNAPKKKLPGINRNNKEFVDIINRIFNFKMPAEIKNADVMIMEESFAGDNRLPGDPDLNLYSEIQKRYPDKKFVVKLHPRTKQDRFSGNFTVLQNSGIPWEVYTLNSKSSQMILMSMACGTMISSKLLYGDEPTNIILIKLFQNNIAVSASNPATYYNDNRIRLFYDQQSMYKDKGKYRIVDNKDQLYSVLDDLLKTN